MSKDNFVPLSQTQLGIYLDCVRRGEGAYNGHFLYTLDNNIDMKRLAAAIDKAVAAHPYMNVRIAERDGEPVQYIPDDIEPYHQDVKYMTEDEWQRELPRIMSEPLKLIGGRLFRLDLIQTESAKYLLRTTHHVFFDRSASNALFNDMQRHIMLMI
ncbi:MAG: hypothetical protein IJM40_07130 [Synergistaceae bacterium]|nr:hypothetical protein [Synergistaceae bacterium]